MITSMNSIESLRERRKELAHFKTECVHKITALGLPNNITHKVIMLFPDKIEERTRLAMIINDLEKDLRKVNLQIEEHQKANGKHEDFLAEYIIQVFKEVLDKEFTSAVIKEAKGRFNGEKHNAIPFKTVISLAEIDMLKSKINRLETTVKNIRAKMGEHMDEMERTMGRSEFSEYVTKMSPLNRSIPSVNNIKNI